MHLPIGFGAPVPPRKKALPLYELVLSAMGSGSKRLDEQGHGEGLLQRLLEIQP